MATAQAESTALSLRVGGVPEHFNLPWAIAEERGLFAKHGVTVKFVEVKEGTGAMITQLKKGDLDMIIALTEGLVADIVQGSELRLLGTYVESPLTWAISVGKDSKYHSVDDLRGTTFGISRFGSGSHLMASVLATQRGWNPQTDISFAVKGDFASLRNAVNDGSTSAFMWETFMTKPYHDKGEVRRVGDISTPWPCFLMASLTNVITDKQAAMQAAIAAVREACEIFHTERVAIPERVSEKFHLKLEDAQKWYRGVMITPSTNVSRSALQRAVKALRDSKAVPIKIPLITRMPSPRKHHPRFFATADGDRKLPHELEEDENVDVSLMIDTRIASLKRDITAMALYDLPDLVTFVLNNVKRLAESKKQSAEPTASDSGDFSYTELLPFDQHHYGGVTADDLAAKMIGLKEPKELAPASQSFQMLNIGSGLGGPARYFAGHYGARVTAIELQDELHRAAAELTGRCEPEVNALVNHIHGDFLQVSETLPSGSFDAVVSWLTLLHFNQKDRARVFAQSLALLKPGGRFFAEDFCALSPLTAEETTMLCDEVYCNYCPQFEQYRSELQAAGFEIVSFDNTTTEFASYTQTRYEGWLRNSSALIKVHGLELWRRLADFYGKIADLYAAGRLGGVRFVVQKPHVRTPA